jgi:hypothetical protein
LGLAGTEIHLEMVIRGAQKKLANNSRSIKFRDEKTPNTSETKNMYWKLQGRQAAEEWEEILKRK